MNGLTQKAPKVAPAVSGSPFPNCMVVGTEYIAFQLEFGAPDSLAIHLRKIINKTLPKTVKVDKKTKDAIKEKIDREMSKLAKKGLLYRDPLDANRWIFIGRK